MTRKVLTDYGVKVDYADDRAGLPVLFAFAGAQGGVASPPQDLWPVNWKIFTRPGLHNGRLSKNGRARRQPGGDERREPGLPSILAKYQTEFFGSHQFASFNSALFFEFCDC